MGKHTFNSLILFLYVTFLSGFNAYAAAPACAQLLEDSLEYSLVEGDPDHIVYYFATGGQDSVSWADGRFETELYEAIKARSEADQKTHPTLIAITLGKMWFPVLSDKRKKAAFPASKLIQKLESLESELGLSPAKRSGFGHSMGGLNLVKTAVSSPGFFDSVATASATLVTFPVFLSQKEWLPNLTLRLGMFIAGINRKDVSSNEVSKKCTSAKGMPKGLSVCGAGDMKRLTQGNMNWVENINDAGGDWVYESVEGANHGGPFDFKRIASFLLGEQ